MQIIVTAFMSLDGVVQAPGGPEEDTDGGFTRGGWSIPYFDPETMGGTWNDALARCEAMLFGRRTWQVSAQTWPARAGDPFADRINAITKYVASRTLTEREMTWSGSSLLAGDDALDAVRELRARPGAGVLVLGSATLAAQLVAADLVDEFVLMVEPIVLGAGKRLFPGRGPLRPLHLESVTTASTGVLVCTYRAER